MGAAAAQVVFHAHNDLVARKLRILEQHRIGVHDHAWRTKAALNCAVFGKRVLQRMKLVAFRQALYRCNFFSANTADGRHTTSNSFLVDNHGACAAETLSTTIFCSCQAQVRAQHPQELSVAFNIQLYGFSIQFETYGFFHIGTLDGVINVTRQFYQTMEQKRNSHHGAAEDTEVHGEKIRAFSRDFKILSNSAVISLF
jgi:hypothetical protein